MIGPLIKIYKNTTEGSELKWLLGMIKGMTKTQPEKGFFLEKILFVVFVLLSYK